MTGIWRRVGSANSITWPAFWMAIVASTLMNLPDRYTVSTPATLPRNLLATLVAVAAMFGVMIGLKAVFLRGVATCPRPGRTIGVFIVGSATRGVVLGAMLAALGTGEARLPFRVAASVFTLTIALAITAVVVDIVRTTALRRTALRAEIARLQAEEDSARERAQTILQRATQAVRDLLLDRLAAVENTPADELGPRLRDDAEAVIRPLSHQLADALPPRPAPGFREIVRISVGDVWRSASLGRPIRPALMAVVILVASTPALVTYNGSLLRGLSYAAIAGLFVFVSLVVVDRTLTPRLPKMRPASRGGAVITGAVVGMAMPAVALATVITATGGESPWRLPLQMLSIGALTMLAVAVGQGFLQQLSSADAALVAASARQRHATAAAQAAAWHEERRVSRALHGPVQSAVISAAMRMESGDRAGAARLLAEAVSHLDDGADAMGVADALESIAEAWSGLCDVNLSMPPDVASVIDHDAPLASAVIDICTEACSNAVRHGGARQVEIVVAEDGDAIALCIADDGAPTGASPDPGLGTAMLDDVAVSWHREREGARTVLRARLPAPARHGSGQSVL